MTPESAPSHSARPLLPREKWRRRAISAFILWNAAVILLTNSQYFFAPMAVLSTLMPYARATRLMQRWTAARTRTLDIWDN